jgi:glycosyltransferase involved in cell wall biosynthesis
MSIQNLGTSTNVAIGLSVLIPWHARPEIAVTLQENADLLNSVGAEVILLISGQDAPRDDIGHGIRSLRRVSLQSTNFNKARALNVGLHFARAQHVLVLDADIILGHEFVEGGLAALDGSTFCTAKWVEETEPLETSEMITRIAEWFKAIARKDPQFVVDCEINVHLSFGGGKDIRQIVHRENLITAARSGPGLLFVDRAHLMDIGGYNSNATFWGWEDNDVEVRLRYERGLRQVELGRVFHVTHSDSVRCLPEEGAHFSNMRNLAMFCARYAEGNYQGTYQSDIQESSPVDLT